MRKVLSVAAVLLLAGAAQAAFVENFDSYADQAAMEAAWPSIFPAAAAPSMLLMQGFDHTTGTSNSIHGVATANSTMRNYRNVGSYTGTDANPLKFEYWINVVDVANTGLRNYLELRSYAGGSYGSGALTGLIAMGCYNNVNATTGINWSVRTLTDNGTGGNTGESWKVTTVARATDWHKLTALIGNSTIKYYVDDALAWTAAATPTTWHAVVLGSGLTSNAGDVAFDDITLEVVPEPATLGLLALGLLAIRRRTA